MGGVLSMIRIIGLSKAVQANDAPAVRMGLGRLMRRSIFQMILYGVVAFLYLLPFLESSELSLSDMPTSIAIYNALLLLIVVLLALDVATLATLKSKGSVSAAAAAVVSNAATVLAYGGKCVWMVILIASGGEGNIAHDVGLGWELWVYFGFAALILTSKVLSVLVLVQIYSKISRGQLNLAGALMADPLLAVASTPVVVVGVPA